MSEAQTAPAQTVAATAAAQGPSPREAAIAQLSSTGLFDEMPAAASPAPRVDASTQATAPAADESDPLDDALFGDDRPWTPERIRELKGVIAAEKKKANELRKKAHNAHAAAEAREAKFKKTKELTLSEKAAIKGQAALLSSEMAALRSGDPDAFLAAVGRLSGHPDPSRFWREAVTLLASSGKLAETPGSDPALKQEVDSIKQFLQQQAEQNRLTAAQQVEAQKEAQILQLRAAQVEYAQKSAATPRVALIANENPEGIDEALMKIKIGEHKRTGSPIDSAAACAILEKVLSDQYEMLQRANGQSPGSNGEREAAGPVPDSGRETRAIAKPGTTQSQSPTQHSITSIPSSLSAASGASKRPATRREQSEAIAAALPQAFWNNLGFDQ